MFETMKSRTSGKKLGYFNYLIALTFLLMFLSQGCSKEENPALPGGDGTSINALIGTWNAISLTQNGGANVIGTSTDQIIITATTFTRNSTGQFCDEGSESCTATGTITVTATSYSTNEAGDINTANYTLSGNTFTIIVDGFTVVYQKV